MATSRQVLGAWGEKRVAKLPCPRCKTQRSFRRLPTNFRCADVICDFCGYLAQVKTMSVKDVSNLPDTLLGAAWGPQKKRMNAGIYFPLFIVLKAGGRSAIYYLATEFQERKLFAKRKPLSKWARRAGWQGFLYRLDTLLPGAIVRIG